MNRCPSRETRTAKRPGSFISGNTNDLCYDGIEKEDHLQPIQYLFSVKKIFLSGSYIFLTVIFFEPGQQTHQNYSLFMTLDKALYNFLYRRIVASCRRQQITRRKA